jgi:hypothetical protein
MFFGRKRRPGSFSLQLAIRATVLAVCAIVAGMIFESQAQPKLNTELEGLHLQRPAILKWVEPFQGHLRYVPVPALVLGIAALALRPFRPVLAIAAMVAAVLAIMILVGSLLAVMAPMYQVPADLT